MGLGTKIASSYLDGKEYDPESMRQRAARSKLGESTAGDIQAVARNKVKASKYGILNTMTIKQLRGAKKVLQNKLANANDLDGKTKQKMEEMVAEYTRTEKQITTYYRTLTGHPQGRQLLAGGKLQTLDTLTIQNIKGLKTINNKDMGKLSTGLGNKIAIGAGVAMIAAGAMHIGKEDASLFALLWKLIKNLSPQNKAGLAMIAAGLAVIGGVAAAKKIAKSRAKHKAQQAKINEVENEMFAEASENEASVDEVALAGAKFEGAALENSANALVSNKNLMKRYEQIIQNNGFDKFTGKTYTPQERKNIKQLIERARALQAELDADKEALKEGKPEKKPEKTEKDPEKGPYTGGEKSKAIAEAEAALDDILFGIGRSNADKTAGIASIDAFIEKLGERGLDQATVDKLKRKAEARKKEINSKMQGQRLTEKASFDKAFDEAEAAMAGGK